MSIIVGAELKADTKNAVREVKKVNEEVKKVSKNAKKAGEDLTEGMVVGNAAVKQLDKVTSGLASALVKVAKAAKLSGKAMRVALLSSGIGAVVILVGLLVEYWEDITDFIMGSNKELEKQISLNSENLDLVDRKLRNVQTYIELQKAEGKNVDDLLKKEKELTQEKRDAFYTSLKAQRILRDNLRAKQKQGKLDEEETEELRKQEKIYLDLVNAYNKFELSLKEPAKKVVETGPTEEEILAEKQRLKAIDDKATSIEEITKLEDDFLQSQLDKQTQEENAVRDKYFAQIQAAEELKIDTTVLEEARQKELQDIRDKYAKEEEDKRKEALEKIQDIVNDATEQTEIEKLEKEKQAALGELELLEATWMEKLRVAAYYQSKINAVVKENNDEELKNDKLKNDARLNMVDQTLGDVTRKFDEQSAASKAAAAASALINTYQGITAELATKTVTPFEIGLKIANIATVAAIGFKSVKDILATTPSNASGGSNPAAGATGPQAPAFNVVGQSGATQLADAIGSQTQQPSRAYVVSSDVTTAQEMDRNIIEGASIG
ncbi:hypothetical protein [uncultured Wocania sp.]|uniref:hypothetical protein n=1 Tax=uncultured Wocania sp. TaxID=2834404 RepID=UPI0030FBEEFA